MGLYAKEHTEKYFSLTAMADQYKAEYDKMTDNRTKINSLINESN